MTCEQPGYPDCLGLDSGELHEEHPGRRRIAVFEHERGIIHIPCREESMPKGAPWRADGWESVLIGSLDMNQETISRLVDAYTVGPYLLLFHRDGPASEVRLNVFPLVKTQLEKQLLCDLVAESGAHSQESVVVRVPFEERIQREESALAAHILRSIPEVGSLTRSRIAEVAVHKMTALGVLFPLILDDSVEEIYVDRPTAPIYFDHTRLGRCVLSGGMSEGDVERVVTLLRSESNLHADRANPSLKADISVYGVPLRFSMTLRPLNPDGMSLEIRKPRTRAYDILELIRNGTLSHEAAAILVLAVSCRFNITITGGPGTGKTTLLNALDMVTPSSWRKVYIEDTVESRFLTGHHQLRLRVDPVDETRGKLCKGDEITKTLHRSPDYLILGEVQNAEHSSALFQAVAAGLHSIQTCHSDSGYGVVSRWISDHGIDRSSVAMMDLLVTLDRPRLAASRRRVREIAEIRRGFEEGLVVLRGLNTVYSCDQPVMDSEKWAEDGAFLLHAREQGVVSHVPALEALVRLIRALERDNGYCGSQSLGDLLWAQGHPMCFMEPSA